MKIAIPDLHFIESRKKAIKTSTDSLFKSLPKKFDSVILLGDIYDRYPNNVERCMFAEFLVKLKARTNNIYLIKGTDSHDYSRAIYNLEDISMITGIKSYDELELEGYVYGHYEMKGAKYSNGFISTTTRTADPRKKYILGHIHLPAQIDNVTYCGSVYKTSFAEKDEQKRYLRILNGVVSVPIETRPMYQVTLEGREGKVTSKDLKLLKDLEKGSEIDLKIIANTDTQTIGAIHRNIAKIKDKFNIEYYKQDINTVNIKVDLPKDLDQKELLRCYCKAKKIDPKLVEKEL